MRTIMVAMRAVDLAAVMAAMRQWLDDHQVQPSLFRYDNAGNEELMAKLDFAADRGAEDFAAAFGRHQILRPERADGRVRPLGRSSERDDLDDERGHRTRCRTRQPQSILCTAHIDPGMAASAFGDFQMECTSKRGENGCVANTAPKYGH